MKAYFIQTDGKSTHLELRDAPVPKPGPGQLLVKVKAASLNRGELIRGPVGIIKAGSSKGMGNDGAGEVEGTGRRVMGRLPGGMAEYALMEEKDAIPVPPNLAWEEAAAIPIAFLVTYDMLAQQGNLKAGEWLLVTGISSGVGVSCLLAAKAVGAKVIGTSGSSQKLESLKRLGLDVAIETRKPDFHDAVMKATGGKGVNLVVNNVGGSVFAETIRCLGYEGRHATVGYLDGQLKAELDIEALHSKRLKLFGVSNKHRNAEQRGVTVAGFTRDWLPLFAGGKLKPLIEKVYDFKDVPSAKDRMESDAHLGKLVVRI